MRRTVALVLAATAASALPTACNLPVGTVGPNDWDLHAVSHDGRTLVMSTFFGGVASDCTRFERWEIGESDDEVEVRAMLWRRRGASSCTDDGAQETLTLRLEEPLGDRRLTGCGEGACDEVGSDIGFATAEVDADGAVVAVLSREALVLLDPASGAVTGRLEGHHGDVRVADGIVVTSGDEGRALAYDAPAGATGAAPEPRWAVAARPLTVTGNLVVTCEEGAEAAQLSGRELGTGDVSWRADVPCPESPAVDGDLLAGTAWARGGDARLVVVDLADGRVLTDETHPAGDGGVALVDDRLVSISTRGSTVWDLDGEELAAGNATGHQMLGVAGGLAFGASLQEPWLVAVDPATANLAWRRQLDGPADWTASVDGGAVFAAEGRTGEVHRLDLAAGNPVWSRAVGTSMAVDVAVHDDTAYVATVTSVLALDLDTGQQRWATTHLAPDTPSDPPAPSEPDAPPAP